MEIQPGKLYAVLTGDVVGSSRLDVSGRRKMNYAIHRAAEGVREVFGEAVPLEVDIYRGDGWQLMLSTPSGSLRAGLLYRTTFRVFMEMDGIDTRVAIGLGSVDLLPDLNVSSGDGPAFRASGASLEDMPRGRRMRFAWPDIDKRGLAEALDVIVQLVDELAIHWTGKQAKAVAGALKGWTQNRVARQWGERQITQQAVAQHLDRASWSAVERALEFFETSIGAAG